MCKYYSVGVLLCCLGFPWFQGNALIIQNYDPTRNDRFLSGFPSSPNPNMNPNFLGKMHDFSGVGWDKEHVDRGVTLISPKHFVGANHFRPTGDIQFLNQMGELKEYEVSHFSTTNFEGEPSDLVIGTFKEAIPPSDFIKSYPILDAGPIDLANPETFNFFLEKEILVFGRSAPAGNSPRLGTNKIDQVLVVDVNGVNKTSTIGYDFDGTSINETMAQSGDSGSPSFLTFNDELTVLGTHFAIGTIMINEEEIPFTFDSFIPFYLDQVSAIVSGEGATIRTIAVVPEPSTKTLMLLAIFSMPILKFLKKLSSQT